MTTGPPPYDHLAEHDAIGQAGVTEQNAISLLTELLGARLLTGNATTSAFSGFGIDRRQARWAGGAGRERRDRLAGTAMGMGEIVVAAADVWATGVSLTASRSSSSSSA
jgi:hypothetical protein